MYVERRQVLLTLASSTVLTAVASGKAAAQTLEDFKKQLSLTPELANNEFIQVFLQTVSRWNLIARQQMSPEELVLPTRDELTELFEAQIDEQVAAQIFGYETEEWGILAKSAFQSLPDVVEPKKPFDEGGVAILTLPYAINLPSLREVFDTPDTLFQNGTMPSERMALPVFITFGESQERSRTEQIGAEDVVWTIFSSWWSKIWPFSVFKRG